MGRGLPHACTQLPAGLLPPQLGVMLTPHRTALSLGFCQHQGPCGCCLDRCSASPFRPVVGTDHDTQHDCLPTPGPQDTHCTPQGGQWALQIPLQPLRMATGLWDPPQGGTEGRAGPSRRRYLEITPHLQASVPSPHAPKGPRPPACTPAPSPGVRPALPAPVPCLLSPPTQPEWPSLPLLVTTCCSHWARRWLHTEHDITRHRPF